jgi:hypothetical protein
MTLTGDAVKLLLRRPASGSFYGAPHTGDVWTGTAGRVVFLYGHYQWADAL